MAGVSKRRAKQLTRYLLSLVAAQYGEGPAFCSHGVDVASQCYCLPPGCMCTSGLNQYVDRNPQVTGNTVGRVDFRHNVQRAGFCF